MFICKVCVTQSKPHVKPERIVVEKRAKDYHDDRGRLAGTGYETVREVLVCGECAKMILGGRHETAKVGTA